MNVVVGSGELTGPEPTGLVLHELLEPVLVELLVLHVVVLVLLCNRAASNKDKQTTKTKIIYKNPC